MLVRELTTTRHALGHALLAGLAVRQSVTTNFDTCFELALDAVHGRDGYKVLTNSLVDGGQPWVLKLHADITRPQSMVLTREDFTRHPEERKAVRGVVQSLMLTSHLLFVGFSLEDDNFLSMAADVTKVRQEAGDTSPPPAGTALALTPASIKRALEDDLDVHHMLEVENVPAAARLLEIFLDRLAWGAAVSHSSSASYLLDDRYVDGLEQADLDLRKALLRLADARPSAPASSAWPRVEAFLKSLGL